ncbi:hypothetical protein NE237_014168 [Protea cynaroides]|uniref:Uncharacterized protein n=1 Tax=Protea cynaroides TaxID=273540 RepID=A0A9Q0JRV6_9MAGN|nr:hypothetical protein NE237_014168 [Protea cynaroides]
MRNRFGFFRRPRGVLEVKKLQCPSGRGLAKSAPRKSVFSNKSGVTDLRFGRSLALRKAKSKGYNLIKGSELKEVVLDLESGFEVRAEVSAMRNRFGFLDGLGSSRSQKIAMPVGKRIGEICRENRCSPTNAEFTDLRFGRSLALRKAKSKGYNLIKGSELKEVVLDLESGFEVRAEFTDLRFGRSLAFWKAKSKGYNLRKGSELKEIVLDLESGFEVRAEVHRRCGTGLGFLGLAKSARKSVFSNKSGVTDLRFGRSLAFRKAKSKGYNLIKGSELKEVSGRGLTKSARKSVFSIKSGVTDLRFGRSLAFRKAKSKRYNLIKGSELKEVVLDLESGFEV